MLFLILFIVTLVIENVLKFIIGSIKMGLQTLLRLEKYGNNSIYRVKNTSYDLYSELLQYSQDHQKCFSKII